MCIGLSSPKTVHQIIKKTNKELDEGARRAITDRKKRQIAEKAINQLAQMEITGARDRIGFTILASRIEATDAMHSYEFTPPPISRRIVAWGNCFFRTQERTVGHRDTLARKFCAKAGLMPFFYPHEKLNRQIVFNEKNRSYVERTALPLIQDWMDGATVVYILNYLIKIPEYLRSDVSSIKYLLSPNLNKITIVNMISILSHSTIIQMSERERESVFNAARPFIRSLMNREPIIALLQEIQRIPEQKRDAIAKSLEQFIKDKKMEDDNVISCLSLMHELSTQEMDSAFFSTERFIKDRGFSAGHIVDALKIIITIPEVERDCAYDAVDRFIKDRGFSAGGIVEALKVITTIREGERDLAYDAVDRFIRGSQFDPYEIVEFLKIVSKISEEERDEVFALTKDFLRIFNPFCFLKIQVLNEIAKIPKEDREFLCSAAISFIEIGKRRSRNVVAFVFNVLERVPKKNWEGIVTSFKKIEGYGNQFIVNYLRDVLFENRASETYGKAQALLVSGKAIKKGASSLPIGYKILPSIVPAKWIAAAEKIRPLTPEETQIITELLSFLNASKANFYKKTPPLMQQYLLTTISLDRIYDMSPMRKIQLLSSICKQGENIKGLSILRSLCERQETAFLKMLLLESPIAELRQAFESALLRDSFVDLSGIDNLIDTYLEAFENTRIQFALEIYVTGLRALVEPEVENDLNRFVRSVLDGTFQEKRYDVSNNPHLRRIQEYDTSKGSHVLDEWKTLSFEAVVKPRDVPSKEIRVSFEKFFKDSLDHGHAIKDQENLLPDLSVFLSANKEVRSQILEKITQRIKVRQELCESSTSGSAAVVMDQVQKLSIEVILSCSLSKEDQVEKIEELERLVSSVEPGIELCNDLRGLITRLKVSEESVFSEKVALYKDWENLFLCGSEVDGSCQRIDGDPELNKCLLAYCLDGKNAMLAVKGPGGKILTRSILRLLWNRTDSKPVLFLEKIYCSGGFSAERVVAINEAAIECADRLGLELFESQDYIYPSQRRVVIESLGSSCYYEYADGADVRDWVPRVMPKGEFTIRNPQRI